MRDGSSERTTIWAAREGRGIFSDKTDKRKERGSWGSLASGGAMKQKRARRIESTQPSFTLRRASGRSGRNAYENSQKLELPKYSRLKCSDGDPPPP